jgi:hypothetical protein
MKKAKAGVEGDMRAEYDFSAMRGGVRGKYFRRFQAGTNVVLLEPEVAKAFPTDAAVNAALRAVLRATSVVRRSSRQPRGRSKRVGPR